MPGTTTLWYLLLYGTGRFFIEGLRTDSLMLGSFRVSQLLSLLLVITAGTLLLIRALKSTKS
jgi:phosphatidylglycerol:prolipoprotein diacylglycerol transferase